MKTEAGVEYNIVNFMERNSDFIQSKLQSESNMDMGIFKVIFPNLGRNIKYIL